MTSKAEKLKCWHTVEAAMESGEIKKPDVCDVCGKPASGVGGSALQAHHDDYNKPLDVQWLCKRCHMKKHHGAEAQWKKDNSTGIYKISLRKNLLREIESPIIMETHGGKGVVYNHCYQGVENGVVFEKDPDKTSVLAEQRPNWFVYECDCSVGMKAGCGKSILGDINFLDIDPYGEPWTIIQAFFDSGYATAEKMAIAVNDGLRQKLKMSGGWSVKAMAEMVQKYGNSEMYKNYLAICREMVEEISSPFGYKITKWAGYYCGYSNQMTHYAAVLCR